MQTKQIVLVRGFDLFFKNASALTLENIAKQLGGRYSYDPQEGRATYMFESIKAIPTSQIPTSHLAVRDLGKMLAITYDCEYLYSELYLTVTKAWLDGFEEDLE